MSFGATSSVSRKEVIKTGFRSFEGHLHGGLAMLPRKGDLFSQKVWLVADVLDLKG